MSGPFTPEKMSDVGVQGVYRERVPVNCYKLHSSDQHRTHIDNAAKKYITSPTPCFSELANHCLPGYIRQFCVVANMGPGIMVQHKAPSICHHELIVIIILPF